MNDFDVRIVPCRSYEKDECRAAMKSLLSGLLDFAKPGMTVGIKPNLVCAASPDKAVTTHPALMLALTEMLKEKQCKVIIGDSPGGMYNSAFLSPVYSASGLKALEDAGAELNRDYGEKETEYESASVCRKFTYTSWLDKCDAIIDFCKLKTHGMMGMSAAVKNLFGIIPGTFKPEYHFRFPEHSVFADMLVDLCEFVKPTLSICDAVIGMEGNGPTKGTPRAVGALLASFSPYSLDLVAADIIGLNKDTVPTVAAAVKRGLCPESVSDLIIDGDLESIKISDYNNIASPDGILFDGGIMGGKLLGRVASYCLSSKPVLHREKCIGCKECFKICPAKAIEMVNKKPIIDRKKCIKCFCCQEFCPVGAMQTKRPLAAKIVNRKKG